MLLVGQDMVKNVDSACAINNDYKYRIGYIFGSTGDKSPQGSESLALTILGLSFL